MILIFGILKSGNAQTVGLVLSGGGAKGLAHIGVLRAFEENNIPIDYISGSSIGAMVGGMYASGYSLDEIRMIFSSYRFKQWKSGEVDAEYYYSYMKEINSEMLNVKFKVDSTETKIYLPSSIVSPHQMDFAFMQILAAPAAAADYDFDNLYIPFRCMSTDIYARKPVAFSKGYLPSAVRASMTFPLYFKPIKIGGRVMFDGGIYDNFPKDILKKDFKPEVIIGVKVASNYDQAEQDDIIGQLENMIAGHTDYSLDAENGILIDIKLKNVKLMDFDALKEIEEIGYKEAMKVIDKIKSRVKRREDIYTRKRNRLKFRNKYPKMIFDKIEVEGLKPKQEKYVKNLIYIKKKTFDIEALKEQYNKIITSEHIDNMYPIAIKNKDDKFFTLRLPVEKAKKFRAGIGGNFSLTDMTQAYLGGSYRFFGRRAYKVNANLYIGSFYNSVDLRGRIYFPVKSEIFTDIKFNYSLFNFQNGRTRSFYEDEKSPYVVENELFTGVRVGLPVSNNSTICTGYNYAINVYEYYQRSAFKSDDTTDKSFLRNHIMYASYKHNTLNYKNYADKGRYVNITGTFVSGNEHHTPGSTSIILQESDLPYDYFAIKAHYSSYYPLFKRLTFGVGATVFVSNKPFLSNYTATISDAPAYNPFPYAYTLFNEKYRSDNFAALNLKTIFHFTDFLSIRLEGQIFQPYKKISPQVQQNIITAIHEAPYINRYYSARAALVYQSLIGPVYLAWHYFQNFSHDFYFSAGLGFYIFNRSAKEFR